jgi:hypothetical protein
MRATVFSRTRLFAGDVVAREGAMRFKRKIAMGRVLAVSLAALVCVFGCDGDFEGRREAADRARLEAMKADVLAYVGEATCQESGECRFIGFGAKGCGAPWTSHNYSTATVDSVELTRMVTDYNNFNKTINERYGAMSDCSVPSQPNPGCVDGTCVDL